MITDRRTGVIIAAFRDGQELWRVIPGYWMGYQEGWGWGHHDMASRGSGDEMSEDGIKTSLAAAELARRRGKNRESVT